jgi:hypothetical protein
MAGKGLVLQSLEPAMLRTTRSKRTTAGALIRGAIAEGPVGYLAAAADAPRNPLIGSETSRTAVLVATGLMAMAVGLLVYLIDRDPSHAALIPAVEALAGSSLFGVLGQWIPSFVHPFAFSLFTAATYPSRASAGYSACAAWWAVNVVFEVVQYPGINWAVAEAAEGELGRAWPARLLSNYVLRGTFDVGDLIAATVGAVGAAGVLYFLHRLEVNHEN